MERHARALVILAAGSVFGLASLIATGVLIQVTGVLNTDSWVELAALAAGTALGAATAGVLCEPRLDRWAAFTNGWLTASSQHDDR